MGSGNVPPQRSELVRGDRNCFHRAFALWRDAMSDEKHEEICRLISSALIEKKGFSLPLLFSSSSVEEQGHAGTWAEAVDISTELCFAVTDLHLLDVAKNVVYF